MAERLFETDDEWVIVTSASSGKVDGVPHRRLEICVGPELFEFRSWERICGLLGALYFARHSYMVELHREDGWGVVLPQLTRAQYETLDSACMEWARVESQRRGL